MARFSRFLSIFLLVAIVLGVLALPSQTPAKANVPSHPRVLVFVSDSMRQDLMVKYAAKGLMPTYKKILDKGIVGKNGMVPNVPPNTGPSWTSLITGASPSVTGVTNNTFHDNTRPLSSWGVSAWESGINRAETLAKRADDAGLTVAALGWQAFEPASIPHGVVVEYYPDWLTGRGIIANYDVPLTWTNLLSPNPTLANTKVTFTDVSGWTNVPVSYSAAKETSFSISDWMYMPVLTYNVYVYDGTNDHKVNYDKVLIAAGKDGAQAAAVLKAGEWSSSITASVADWYGTLLTGGFYAKVVDFAPDLSKFRLYYTPVTRIRAVPDALEEDLATRFGAVMPTDYSPYLLGLVDAQTFVEQHSMAQNLLGNHIYPYILDKYQPDLALVGNEWTDANQHRFLALATPGTPVYDPVKGPTYERYIQNAYKGADNMLASLWAEMRDATVFVTSDHGVSLTWKSLNANYVLQQIGLYNPASFGQSQAVAFIAGGTAQIYINLQGRNPGGVVPAADYEAVRQQIVDAFNALGPDKIERVLLKEETATISTALGQTYNMLDPDRTGDVVVFSAPPYQFDAPTANQVVGDAPIYGQHGFVPNGDLDRYSVFAAYGPKTLYRPVSQPIVTVLDLAPTVAYVLGIDPPAQSQGVVLDIVKRETVR